MIHKTAINVEFLLEFGIRHKQVRQFVDAPIGRHSEKPAVVRERLVELMGDVPRLEMFARAVAAGWDCWGNEEMYEDELPEMTDEEYSAWFALSRVDGVRIGPRVCR